MEVFAGFLTHTDAQVARLLDFVDELGESENTIVIVMSDNGASAEGGARGSFNEQYFFNFIPESLEENLKRIDDLGTPKANNHYPWGWAWAGNTPLKRFKRDTHEGGVGGSRSLCTGPPASAPRGGTASSVRARHRPPTDAARAHRDRPSRFHLGCRAVPDRGGELRSRPSTIRRLRRRTPRSTTRCSARVRCITTDGRRSSSIRHPSSPTTDRTPRRPFDEDVWELYHVAEDFSEVDDLAASHPAKLEELKELWWVEAEKYQVLPLNNQPGLFGDPRYRRNRHEFLGPAGPLAEALAPNLKNRSFVIQADLVPSGPGPSVA